MRRYGRASAALPQAARDQRTNTERDRGRLQYSPYLRRLAGVTQVVSPELTSAKLHSRATHTYKVAMISREIAEHLERRAATEPDIRNQIARAGGLDVVACEVAGLAHDLGHPPFGHAGETELNRLLRNRGVPEGFEGNAQSFRIVCTLDFHGYDRGLDLTNVVLAAILKYPWTRQPDADPSDDREQSKFGAYHAEAEMLRRARAAVMPGIDDDVILEAKGIPPQSLEASIMDLADDIAYSIHDLEDFCSQGFIDLAAAIDTLDQFIAKPGAPENTFATAAAKLAKYNASMYSSTEYVKAANRIRGMLDQVNVPLSSQGKRDLQLRGDLSRKIGEFFDAMTVVEREGWPNVTLDPPQWHDMQVMKRVTKTFLVGTGRMAQIQRAQRETIERLFVGLEHWVLNAAEDEALPEALQDFLDLTVATRSRAGKLAPGHYRAIADYICTMSDSEAFLRAQWISGTEIPGMANLGLVE